MNVIPPTRPQSAHPAQADALPMANFARQHDLSQFDAQRCDRILPQASAHGLRFEQRWLMVMMTLDALIDRATQVLQLRSHDPQSYDTLFGEWVHIQEAGLQADGAFITHITNMAYGHPEVPIRLSAIDIVGGQRQWTFHFNELPIALRTAPESLQPHSPPTLVLLSGRTPWGPSHMLASICASDADLVALQTIHDAATHLNDLAERLLVDMRRGPFSYHMAHRMTHNLVTSLLQSSRDTLRLHCANGHAQALDVDLRRRSANDDQGGP